MRTEVAYSNTEVTGDPKKSSQWTTFLGCFAIKGAQRCRDSRLKKMEPSLRQEKQ